MTTRVPRRVAEAYRLDDEEARPISIGWINRTLVVRRRGEPFVLQRLHPVFSPEVNLDIEAITEHLAAAGLITPRLVRSADGEAWVEAEDGVWRLMTFVSGRTLEALDTEALARAAGGLIARFHRALSGVEHTFHFTRPGAHDTAAHLAKLAALIEAHPKHRPELELGRLAEQILEAGEALPPLRGLPERIIHGDPKATNILFEPDRPAARALVDLDTMAHGTVAVELGDAMRSWCNRTSESDPGASFDASLFAAAMEGYAEEARGLLGAEERAALVAGVETIAVELASRFAADAYEDRYFGWDERRFASRVEHNVARARSQLSLARSVHARRSQLERVVEDAFGVR